MACSTPDECMGESEDVFGSVAQFYHFKILYDQTWDYAKICKKMFIEEEPYLCVIEHVNQPNTHVHFQGKSYLTQNSMKARITRLVRGHHLRKLNPKCRPASMSVRAPDVVGFQYMAKENKKEYILVRNKFTDEEIAELAAKSVMHCTKLKTVVSDFVKVLSERELRDAVPVGYRGDANRMINAMAVYLFKQQKQGVIELPKYNKHHTRQSVINGLLQNPHLHEDAKAVLWVS